MLAGRSAARLAEQHASQEAAIAGFLRRMGPGPRFVRNPRASRVEPGIRAPLARRRLLRLAAAAAAVAGWAAPSNAAAQKVSQAEALYQDRPKGGLSCAACTLFRPPAACAVVEGRISPYGWCRFFDLPD